MMSKPERKIEVKKRIFVQGLLEWFSKNKRDFPWRRASNPYIVLISEIFLQKTRAETVEAFLPTFLKKYPSVEALAKKSVKEIEKDIESLGLHRQRAPKLKKLAGAILAKHEGGIPEKKKDLLELPGVGEYVANAFMCASGHANVPAVDVNAVRIFKRIFSLHTIADARRDPVLLKFVAEIVPTGRAKEFNWALMDFAAKVCKAKNPLCGECFAKEICASISAGVQR